MCGWDDTYSFDACCETEAFEVGGIPCALGDTQYATCCTDLTPDPMWWCEDDPTFTDDAGYTCADWAAGEFSCVDDTAQYVEGARSALWAACAASCGLCQEWQGLAGCWSDNFSYNSCCTGDGDGDGTAGDQTCWTAEHNFDSCQCVEPTKPPDVCDADQIVLARPAAGAAADSSLEPSFFVASVAACSYGPISIGQPGYTVPVHGTCVWDALWGNGYCDSADNSPNGPSYNPDAAAWYDQWHGDLNCEAAGFGAPTNCS